MKAQSRFHCRKREFDLCFEPPLPTGMCNSQCPRCRTVHTVHLNYELDSWLSQFILDISSQNPCTAFHFSHLAPFLDIIFPLQVMAVYCILRVNMMSDKVPVVVVLIQFYCLDIKIQQKGRRARKTMLPGSYLASIFLSIIRLTLSP